MADSADTEWLKVIALVALNLCGVVVAQFDNYYNWPESSPPVVKSEVHTAGKEARVRCQIKERYRHIQNGLNLTWEYKACRGRQSAACMEEDGWSTLCGTPRRSPCPPVLSLIEPQPHNSGLYRCHITLHNNIVMLNVYMLEFIEKRRNPPVIMGGMATNVTVVSPQLAVLQCKVQSSMPPTVRWFRRLESATLSVQPSLQNFIQYLNNTYQLLNCCPVAPLSQKDVYLSKLVISPSSVYDSGFYICLAINDANYTYREAYLNILPVLRPSRVKAETGSFLGLFLIPVALALIPAMAWMMCLRPRNLKSLEVPPPNPPLPTGVHTLPSRHTMPDQRLSLLSDGGSLDRSYLPVIIVTQKEPN